MGHFSNECRMPKTGRKGNASDVIDCRKKYFDLLISKENAFMSEEKDWAAAKEDSDEEEFINLALMANSKELEASSAGSQVLTQTYLNFLKKIANLLLMKYQMNCIICISPLCH